MGSYCDYVYYRLETQQVPITAIHEEAKHLPLVFAIIISVREDMCKLAEDICNGKRIP